MEHNRENRSGGRHGQVGSTQRHCREKKVEISLCFPSLITIILHNSQISAEEIGRKGGTGDDWRWEGWATKREMSQSPLQLSGNGHSPLMQWDQPRQEWGVAYHGMVNVGLTDQPENVTAGINESRESLCDFITKHATMEIWPVPLLPEWHKSFFKSNERKCWRVVQSTCDRN